MKKIVFEESKLPGYPGRTIQNATEADITFAFAIDFESAGEKLTKRAVHWANKKYIPINAVNKTISIERFEPMFKILKAYDHISMINVAGNGIYSMHNVFTQDECNEMVKSFFELLFSSGLLPHLKNFTSGGQTGFDEAGSIAGALLDYNSRILVPKNWLFRDITGKDISGEKQFKARFKDFI